MHLPTWHVLFLCTFCALTMNPGGMGVRSPNKGPFRLVANLLCHSLLGRCSCRANRPVSVWKWETSEAGGAACQLRHAAHGHCAAAGAAHPGHVVVSCQGLSARPHSSPWSRAAGKQGFILQSILPKQSPAYVGMEYTCSCQSCRWQGHTQAWVLLTCTATTQA